MPSGDELKKIPNYQREVDQIRTAFDDYTPFSRQWAGLHLIISLLLIAPYLSDSCLALPSAHFSGARSLRRLTRAITAIELRLPQNRALLASATTAGQSLEAKATRVFFIARTRRRVGSIKFTLNDQILNVENNSPYETYSMLLPDDQQTLCAQAYSRPDQTGNSGTPYCVSIRYNPGSPPLSAGSADTGRTSTLLPRTWYGSGLYATNNANEPIRKTNLSIEFESPASGSLLAFQTYYIYKYDRPGAYHDGDGGKYRISLLEVNNNGIPLSERALDVLAYSPSLRIFKGSSGKRYSTDPRNSYGEDVRFKELSLPAKPYIQAGHRYALLFENIHPQQELNWLSLNGLAARDSNSSDSAFLAPEFRGILPASASLIYRRSGAVISYNTPVFALQYDFDGDGSVDYTFGGGYHEAGYLIGGGSHPDSRVTRYQSVREIFTPRTSITITGITVFTGECGQGGKLHYALKSSAGTILASGNFDSLKGSCSTTGLRETYSGFLTTIPLTAHTEYSLEFSTDSASVFYIPFVRHGGSGAISYILGSGTRFQEGRGQAGMIKAGTTIWHDIRNQSMDTGGAPADYSFYFITAPHVPANDEQ